MDMMNGITKSVGISSTHRQELLERFVQNNRTDLIKSVLSDLNGIKVTIFPDHDASLDALGAQIRDGQLVAFPTETVYGLGADAQNEKALREIYRVKKRPLTDPIIVHVLEAEDVFRLTEIGSEKEKLLFEKLSDKYWPGPLTIVLKANLNILPLIVTAQTGFVGLRCPKHEFARKLIKAASRPIGAPSANLFSHVSPTSACHVFNDFYDQDISIVDGSRCEYGIESTVIKITDHNVYILREGSLQTHRLVQFIKEEFGHSVTVELLRKTHKQSENKNMQAPGQLLKHYAPYLPCYYSHSHQIQLSKDHKIRDEGLQYGFCEAVLISFESIMGPLPKLFKWHLNPQISNVSNFEQANTMKQEDQFCSMSQKKLMRSFYHMLRKAENLQAKVILIAWDSQKAGTVWDKIFRATQGKQAQIV